MDTLDKFRKRYEFNFNDPPLGKGGFGKVYKAYDRQEREWVAIKKSEVDKDLEKYSLYQEAQFTIHLYHPNVIDYREVYRFDTETGQCDFVVMEYANDGDLEDFILKFPDIEAIKSVIIGILEGLKFLHQNNIIHRDLKPSNVLLDNCNGKLTPKIIDFGISKSITNEESLISNIIGSAEYMSPEQLGGFEGKIRYNSDFWSLGTIVYQIFLGELPFGSRSQGYSSQQIINGILKSKIPAKIDNIEPPFFDFVRCCLVRDPRQRVAAADQLIALLQNEKIPEEVKESIQLTSTKLKNNQKTASRTSFVFWLMVISQMIFILWDLSYFLIEQSFYFDLYFIGEIASRFFFVISLVAASYFIKWMYNAYFNLHAIKKVQLKYKKEWAIAGWFIPVVNLFMPFQIVQEIFLKTQQATLGSKPVHSSAKVGWWWALFLLTSFLGANTPYLIDPFYLTSLEILGFLLLRFVGLVSLLVAISMVRITSHYEEELYNAFEKEAYS